MTNSMHRQGSIESLRKDWIIFTHSAKGYNKEGSAPLHKRFADICLKHKPSNMGIGAFIHEDTNFIAQLMKDRYDSTKFHNGAPTQEQLNDWARMIENMGDHSAYAVFSSVEAIEAAVKEIKAADLGLCICINALHDDADVMLRKCGIVRHSVEHSLGFHGAVNKLPSQEIMELSTMCGHGMVSYNLSKKMVDSVRLGQMTPERAGEYLKKTCSCGVFNPIRAAEIIRDHIADKVVTE
jgi:hypothetical protein